MGTPDLGQHHLMDKKIVDFIIREARLAKGDVVLDIGAGRGVLTKEIMKRCGCIAVEVESSCREGLEETGACVIIGNALDHVPSLRFTKIVANIPYAISEPLFFQLSKKKFDLAVMTIGENFLTVLQQETKIGIFFRSAYDITLLRDVPKNAFSPPPRVRSCIIKAVPKDLTPENEIIRRLLFLDDKKLKNAILKAYEGVRTKKEVRALTAAPFFEKSILGISNEDARKLLKTINELLSSPQKPPL